MQTKKWKVTRKIGRHHIAFFRANLLGQDLAAMSDLYLETGMDLRCAKTTLLWVQDTLRQASLRHGKRGNARLLKMRIAVGGEAECASTPSLDDYRNEVDPDNFFTEKELLEAYVEAYPETIDFKQRKRQRLIDKQLAALKWIEPLISTEPVREDFVSAWFDEAISRRLVLAKLPTIGHLLDRITTNGYRWWVSVPRLGEKGAARIVTWLRGYESSLGELPTQSLTPLRSLSVGVLMQTRAQSTSIAPLEHFAAPADLDGSIGSNRALGAPRIDATSDHQAINSWLATKSGNQNTQRAYQKEAERILLWSILERSKALSDLSVEDCAAYRDWLSMLGRTNEQAWTFRQAQSMWLGSKGGARHKQAWRPFDGALTVSSVRHAITIVSNLFEWLVRVQYCVFNPWSAVSKSLVIASSDSSPDVEFMRAFSVGQWNYLIAQLHGDSDDKHLIRLRFVLPFAYATGLRISELVDATVGRIYTMPLAEGVGVRWMLKVFGKGGKWRAVPIPSEVMTALQIYFEHRGLNLDITSNAVNTPLIASEIGDSSVTTSALSKSLRGFFGGIARSLQEDGKQVEAKAFERATTHWLRHTCGSHLALSGVPLNFIQRLLGHTSLQTTSIYTDTSDENLWRAVEQASNKSGVKYAA
ncbi:MAG: tyrosine-type recombinase/integrase [Gallionella sp.]